MTTVPVNTMIKSHVVTDKDDFRCSELHRQVQCVKPAVATPAEHARLFDQQPVVVLYDGDAMDAPRRSIASRVLADLDTVELWNPRKRSPPRIVAGVENVRPWREAPGVVDGDYSAASLDLSERRVAR